MLMLAAGLVLGLVGLTLAAIPATSVALVWGSGICIGVALALILGSAPKVNGIVKDKLTNGR